MEIDFCKELSQTVCPVPTYRLEFDAYRSDLEELSLGPRDAAGLVRIEMAQQEYQIHRDKYERLRSDVTIKLKFLEENKVCFFTPSEIWAQAHKEALFFELNSMSFFNSFYFKCTIQMNYYTLFYQSGQK